MNPEVGVKASRAIRKIGHFFLILLDIDVLESGEARRHVFCNSVMFFRRLLALALAGSCTNELLEYIFCVKKTMNKLISSTSVYAHIQTYIR